MQTYVHVDSNGKVTELGIGAPIIISDGINMKTYEWNIITAISDTELATLDIYLVNPFLTPPEGQTQKGVTYSFADGVVTVIGEFGPIPTIVDPIGPILPPPMPS